MKWFNYFLLMLLFASCVNQIDTEIESIENKVPITFSAKITPASTRVVDNAFEVGDKVGLYAAIAGSSLDEERYIDNLLLSYGKSKKMTPVRDVYYPLEGENLDFYAYYPYRSDALQNGEMSMPISVAENQTKDLDFSLSDFLVVNGLTIENGEESVELEFKHKLSKLDIKIVFEDEESAADAFASNPTILATDFYTEANYNFSTDAILSPSAPNDLVPHGEWILDGTTLYGKELLIVPQSVKEQRFVLDMAGKIYTCSLDEETLIEGKQYNWKINAETLVEGALNEIKASISDWGIGEEQNTGTDVNITKINVESFSFATSNIYHIYNGSTPIAEICKEYLYKEGVVDSRAIVVYPMVNGVTNLEEGLVLQLLDETGDVHGGSVSWDKATNELTYSAGNLSPIQSFYINTNKEIVTTLPNNALQVNVNAYVLRDMRSGSLQKYPLVKIATQYWMREDLYATHYVNGSSITEVTALNGTAGYAKNADASHYFYTGEAVETGMLAPDGWRIPNYDEWEKLNSYLKNTDALKDGEWEELSGQPYYPGNNKTGFHMHAVGAYVDRDGVLTLVNTGTLNAYWIDPEQSLQMQEAVQVYQFLSSDNEFIIKSGLVKDKDYYQAFSVRCIKE
jgi:uncharacterized protein (TIGR02145 family)